MKYRLEQIKTEIDEPMDTMPARIAKLLRIRESDIKEWEIRRKSVDSRKKPHIQFVYTVDFKLKDERRKLKRLPNLAVIDEEKEASAVRPPEPGKGKLHGRPVVIGMGPAGLFAALELAKAGYRPLVIERGPEMERRTEAVEKFRREHVLNPEANMLFGEGGAGTFSDGKIGTGIKDGLVRSVLTEFRDAGAGDEIMYLAKPHIGTDVLREVIVNIRRKIESLGGEILFDTKLESIETEGGRLKSINVKRRKENQQAELTNDSRKNADSPQNSADSFFSIGTGALVLAIGHSARDTFAMINDAGLEMRQKPFSIGVRMEHPQDMINNAQYGEENRDRFSDAVTAEKTPGKLPPADYKLSCKASNGRGVYSFCMCPGGEVVVCTTAEEELCVNGMSCRRRDSGIANSGILCDVRIDDFGSDDVLAGVRFQEKYERLAFINGGRSFEPPRCTMGEFLDGQYCEPQETAGAVHSMTEPGRESTVAGGKLTGADGKMAGESGKLTGAGSVRNSLPDFAFEAIREAVPVFARKIAGYDDPGAVVTAVETRSSSPVRIVRGEDGQSNIKGIYPAGEGAGYAGGIMSAACDGIRAAWHIIERYSYLSTL